MHVKPESSNIGLFRAARMGGTGVSSGTGETDQLDWQPSLGRWTTSSSEGQAWLWPNCDTQVATDLDFDNLIKVDPGPVTPVTFNQFTVYERLGCTTAAIGEDMIESFARDLFEVDTQAMVEIGLEYGYGGPGLISSATLVTGTSLPFLYAVQHLLRQWKEHGAAHRRPIIHAPIDFAPIAADAHLVDLAGNSPVGAGGACRFAFGAYGTPVAAGITPSSGAVGSQLTAPDSWIYITGPVEVWVDDVYDADPEGTPLEERRKNTLDELIERNVAYRFDPALCMAIKATAAVA